MQAVARALVADDFAAYNLAKAREDQLEVLVLCNRVELAHEKDIFRWRDFGKGKVAHHLERECLRTSFALPANLLQSLRVGLFIEALIVGHANGCELGGRGYWALWRLYEPSGVVVGVVEHHRVQDTDILEGATLVVDVCVVDLVQCVEALDDSAENGSLAVQEVDIGAEGDDELAAGVALVRIVWIRGGGHADGAHGGVLQAVLELGREVLLARVGGIEQAPYRAAAICIAGSWANGVAGLKGEVGLDAMHRREVVVLQFA